MDDLEVLVLAAGQGQRLNGQPKAFLTLAGQTLLERSVRLGREFSTLVTAAVPASDVARGTELVGDRAHVIAGGASLGQSFRLLLDTATASRVLLLDVAHPLVDDDLCRAVLDAAGKHDAAAAVVRANDQVIDADALPTGPAGSVFLFQKPITFRLADIQRGLAAANPALPGVLDLLHLASVKVHLIESDLWNVKLTTDRDWRLISLLADRPAGPESPS